MSPKQLMLTAIRKQPVERLPVATYNFHPFGGFSGALGYQPMLDALAEAKDVGVMWKCSFRRQGGRFAGMKSEQQSVGDAVRTVSWIDTPKGRLEMVYQKPKDQPGYYVESLIKDDEDVEKFVSLPCEPVTVDLSPTKEVYKKLGDRGLAFVGYEDPFYSVAHWFSFEDFAMRCVDQLPLLRSLVEREFQRIQVEFGQVLEQARGYDFVFHTAGPEVATPPLLGPGVFDALITPFEKRLVSMIREAGQLSCIHCHGKVKTVLGKFLDIGIDALEPMEPPPQGDICLADALERVQGRMCLLGYIQDQDLYLAKPGEMREKVRQIRSVVKGRTGYVMTPSATPFMSPPPEAFVRNYVEFLTAAQEAC
jgi:hypothetical protein